MKRTVAALLAALVSTLAYSGCGDAERPPLRAGSDASTTAPPPRSAEPDGGDDGRSPILTGLPGEGVAVVDGDAVVLVSVEGDVLQRLDGFSLGSGPQVPGGIVLVAGGVHYLLDARTGELRRRRGAAPVAGASTGRHPELPDACVVADRYAGSSFAVCRGDDGYTASVVRLDADGTRTVIAEPEAGQSWDAIMVSPDGRRFLAQLSSDCGPPRVVVGSTSTPDVHTLGSIIGAREEPHAFALGWTARGGIVFASEGNCGPPVGGPGVYSFDGRELRTIYTPQVATDWTDAGMWSRRRP